MNNNLIIVIIDDEPKAREVLRLYINKIFPENRFEMHLCNSVKEGIEAIEKQLPDLVFLDIEMSEANGFELFHQVKKDAFEVVFVTAYAEFIDKSVNEIGCFGYLNKPLEKEKLQRIFERYQEKEPSKKYLKFMNTIKGRHELVDLYQVLYFKSDNQYCDAYSENGKQFIGELLREVEQRLPFDFFVRINRSYIVNMNYVDRFDERKNVLILKHSNEQWEKEIKVTDAYKEKIRKMFL